MNATEPQILYMVLILPSLFGLTLVGEGLHKIIKSDKAGWISFIAGLLFMITVIASYYFIAPAFIKR